MKIVLGRYMNKAVTIAQAIIKIAPPGALRMASTAGQAIHMQTKTNPTLLKVSEASQR
jgi:hypothetical protein